jgi:ribosome biogenesis protein ERB1
MASGASDGHLRMWEVQSGRLLRSWDLSRAVSGLGGERPEEAEEAGASAGPAPVVALDWNPNRSHHCLLAAVGPCVVVVATGTAGQSDADVTEALLASAVAGGGEASNGAGAKKAVRWVPLGAGEKRDGAAAISSFDRAAGPVCALRTAGEVSAVRWQAKGDYFLSVSPKAGAAAVLIHQLSRGHSQQPFGKAKGEAQVACFHPNKPFLYVLLV